MLSKNLIGIYPNLARDPRAILICHPVNSQFLVRRLPHTLKTNNNLRTSVILNRYK